MIAVIAILAMTASAQNINREVGSFTLQPKVGLSMGSSNHSTFHKTNKSGGIFASKFIYATGAKAPAKKAKENAGWATRFVGAWEDDRTADEIVDDIRSARTW